MINRIKKWALCRERGKSEVITFFLYLAGISLISLFHERWFDEAQAWNIAKTATLKEILFELPHYEGHPPLWDLILLPFAKLGAPYSLSLYIVNTLFMGIFVWLILFKSPFPKFVRCMLPFNFYFFYQYGVISRPYCIVVLAITLCAMTFKNKDTKPLPYILSLVLLCAIHSYGILIAGGLGIVWIVKIFALHIREKDMAGLFRDKRCWLLLGLAVFAVMVLLCIMPKSDTYSARSTDIFDIELSATSFFEMITYFGEATFCQIFSGYDFYDETLSTLVVGTMCLLIMAIIISILKANKKAAEFVVPYIFVATFGILFYFSPHHSGVITAFVVFAFWITFDTDQPVKIPPLYKKLISKCKGTIQKVIYAVPVILFLIPVAWSAVSSTNEIIYTYWYNDAVQFIKDYNLEDYNIASNWKQKPINYDEHQSFFDDTKYEYTDYPLTQGFSSSLSPYFDGNIFCNFNVDKTERSFAYYKKTTQSQNDEIFEQWRANGTPDIVIGRCKITNAYPDLDIHDYIPVKEITAYRVYKFSKSTDKVSIYMKKDLAEQLGLEKIDSRPLF